MQSRPVLSDTTKIKRGSRTRYEPVEMTDQSVYDLASIGMTLREIASMFKVTNEALIAHHSEAFHLGKGALKSKPRLILSRMLDDVMDELENAGDGENVNGTRNILLGAIAQMDKYVLKDPTTGKDVEDDSTKLSDDELAMKIAQLLKAQA